ncbi:TPA: two-component system sensor histidine kinase RstB [Escherichia coli]
MNTIVFVEDDAEVGSLIAAYLAKHDMQVTVEPRGDRAEETILRENPDLVLLDIMLPGKDGMTICRDLRAKWSGPIVLLTSLDSDMNHILALEMGACDYILKTTPPAVLLARLRLHLRQNEQATVTKGIQETSLTPYKALHFGTLTIDPINRVVTLANTEISLSTADFELLWELATHAGQIMDRDALLKNLRGVSYDGLDRSVDVAISRLRKKLLDNAAEPYRIKTVRNICFLVMSLLVGLVYKFTAERAGKQSLDDLMNSSLYLMRSELREIPPHDWGKTLKEMDLNLSFDLRVEPLSKYHLDDISMHRLRGGEIVALDDQYTFLQRIPRSHYVLAVGPVPYLYYLHQMRLLDIALIAFIAISLAFPVFIWMRPHWQDMLKLEAAAQRFGDGHLNERIHFDEGSSFERLGVAFNQMADNINALIASKKQLIDGIAHELRTPLVRLRYRLEMSDNLSTAESQALNRDISQLEALIEELLTYARLDRPQNELHLSEPDLPLWLSTHLADIQAVTPDKTVRIKTLAQGHYAALDMRLMERVLDNLLNNALRYCHSTVETSLLLSGNRATLIVEDDGPGIAPENREHIFEPFVRLDPSRDRSTGGCGLGLAIVHSIALAMGGTVNCDTSELGGARFSFSWPLWHNIPQFTSA